jgi:hypothetical protein
MPPKILLSYHNVLSFLCLCSAGQVLRVLDNRWVVPYSPYLCAKYDAHINVEICSSVTAVKYMYKYVYKGHDRAVVEVSGVGGDGQAAEVDEDEVRRFLESRFLSSSEAAWRLLEFPIHAERPNVVRLAIHLPGQHMVYFDEAMRLQHAYWMVQVEPISAGSGSCAP